MSVNFNKVKLAYKVFDPIIKESFARTKRLSGWVNPYRLKFNFFDDFTPIEFMTWQALRSWGQAPFYQQYPVGRYYLDFGNPNVKVGIECDGKEFHTDKERDQIRDTYLNSLGWDIYRISGADCNRIIRLPEEMEDNDPIREEYMLTTVEGLIESISLVYFGVNLFGDTHETISLVSKCLGRRISIRSYDFEKMLSHAINSYYNKLEFNQ